MCLCVFGHTYLKTSHNTTVPERRSVILSTCTESLPCSSYDAVIYTFLSIFNPGGSCCPVFFFLECAHLIMKYHVHYHYHAVLWSFSRLSLKFSPHASPCFMSHTEVLWLTAFSDGAKMNDREAWRLMESGSAILVFTCPPDYCTWQSLPPIAFR